MNGFSLTVRKNPISPPLLETEEASSIEVRDSNGKLDMLLLLIPGRPVAIMTSADSDKNFEENCRNLGFQVYKSK